MAQHDSHPWRGSKLTSRSLSLADDIQHHFGVLAKSFEDIDRVSQPFVSDGLIEGGVTPLRLNEILKSLRESLTSPDVPESWFVNPQVVADAVLARRNADLSIQEQRATLSEYVDEVAELFPDDAANSLLEDGIDSWMSQFNEPMPNRIREQRDALVFHAVQINAIVDRAAAATRAFEVLVEQLQLPIKAELPINSLPKLIRLAQVVAESGPMRPGWFDSDNWTRLRTVCDDALAALELATELGARVADRLPVDRVAKLSNTVADWTSVGEAWHVVQRFCPDANDVSLVSLVRVSDEAEQIVRNAMDAASAVANGLHLTDSFRLSLRHLRVLSESFQTSDAGFMHGAWCNSGIRVRLFAACDAILSDLAEANELKAALQDSMSHRAFKPSASEVARRSVAFRSLFKRLFGGFGAFRNEVADLYKNGVPQTKTLLADFNRLNTFHRRMNDVNEAVAEFADHLPDGHVIDDLEAWNRLRASIVSQETLVNAVPELAALLPQKTVKVDQTATRTALDRLASELNRLQLIANDSPLAELFADTATLTDVAHALTSVSNAAKACRQTWEQVTPVFTSLPTNMETLLADGKIARDFTGSMAEVSAIFDREQDLLPLCSTASDRAAWESTKSGIEAAERLSGLVRSPDALREVLCVAGRINTDALAVAADNADAALHSLDQSLDVISDVLLLSPPCSPQVEPRKRPLAMLETMSHEAVTQFSLRSQQLDRIAEVIELDGDVSIDQLPDHSVAVTALRKGLRSHAESEAILESNGAELPQHLEDNGVVAATWLSQLAAAGAMPVLHMAVASDGGLRQQVTHTIDEIKRAVNDTFKKSWEFLKTVFDLKADVSTGIKFLDSPVGILATHLLGLKSEIQSLDDWLKFSRWRRDMKDAGFASVIDELLAKEFEPQEVVDVVAVHFYRQLFDHYAHGEQLLGEFDMVEHERIRERFRELDQWEVKAAATRIRQFQLGRDDRPRPGWNVPDSSELGILQRETQKKRRHMSLRRLFSEIPGVLQRLKPCIMMSPLSVSTFLQSDELRFDLVIFDEASQVFPWDAIGAIYRGSQLIVAGDEKQLPPTNFFNRGDIDSDSEDNEEDISDFESILSLCKSINMPNKRLRWHYRSRREPLIAFSNRHFYGGDLVTFPSVRDASGDSVRLEFVPNGRWINRKNIPEAERVADLVIAHHRDRPETSLGVCLCNGSQ